MSDPITIRLATPADASGVARVHVDTWRAAYRGIVSDEYLEGLQYDRSEERWARAFSNPDNSSFRYLAEDGATGAIIGFAAGGPQRSDVPGYDGELYAIYVLQDRQGKGVGRALTQAVAQGLLERGMRSMIVWVLTENAPARRFYESLGGKWVREQEFELDGLMLNETGYGWEDISNLALANRDRTRSKGD